MLLHVICAWLWVRQKYNRKEWVWIWIHAASIRPITLTHLSGPIFWIFIVPAPNDHNISVGGIICCWPSEFLAACGNLSLSKLYTCWVSGNFTLHYVYNIFFRWINNYTLFGQSGTIHAFKLEKEPYTMSLLQSAYLWKTFFVNMVHHDDLIIKGDARSPRTVNKTKNKVYFNWSTKTFQFYWYTVKFNSPMSQ